MSAPSKPNPMRVLRAWLFRERAVRGPLAIELDVVDGQITREEKAVAAAAGEAEGIEQKIHRIGGKIREALTDKRTPGIIDADESRNLASEVIGTAVAAHHHTQSLEALSS